MAISPENRPGVLVLAGPEVTNDSHVRPVHDEDAPSAVRRRDDLPVWRHGTPAPLPFPATDRLAEDLRRPGSGVHAENAVMVQRQAVDAAVGTEHAAAPLPRGRSKPTEHPRLRAVDHKHGLRGVGDANDFAVASCHAGAVLVLPVPEVADEGGFFRVRVDSQQRRGVKREAEDGAIAGDARGVPLGPLPRKAADGAAGLAVDDEDRVAMRGHREDLLPRDRGAVELPFLPAELAEALQRSA